MMEKSVGTLVNKGLRKRIKCWKNKATQQEALEKIGREKFGVKELDDWYSISPEDVSSKLKFIGKFYKGSLFCALKQLYPQHNWDWFRFSERVHFNETKTQRTSLEKLGRERFGVKELNDWYSVSSRSVSKELNFIRKDYNGSLYNALKELYPQHDWNSLRFRMPSGYWKQEKVQRDALESFGREHLGVRTLDDWYSVPKEVVINEFWFIKKYYNGSIFDALKQLYPHHDWNRFQFSRVPAGYWRDENAQRDALERVGREQLGVKELDDWYSVSAMNVHRELSFVKNYYNGSLSIALAHLYPRHDWDPLRFQRIPHHYWKQRSAEYYGMFKNWKQTHDLCTIRDWYELPPQQLKVLKLAAKGIFGSAMRMFAEWFPETLRKTHFTTQFELQSMLKHVISDVTIRHHVDATPTTVRQHNKQIEGTLALLLPTSNV